MNRGALFGLLAAALFGLSAPAAKLLLLETSPLMLAALLYLGGGLGLSLYRLMRPDGAEARLQRGDLPTMSAVVALGGVLGPVLLLTGLRRVSAVVGSLLLNLEAPFTVAIAVLVFAEYLGRRAAAGMLLIVGGAAVLELEPGEIRGDLVGAAMIAAACLCWALDNNLTQRLTLRDPFAVVRLKALSAGAFNLALAFAVGDALPRASIVVAALALGSLSYGLSVVLDAYALRLVGAVREASYFATAPFVGAVAAAIFLREPLGAASLVAMALMAAGIALLLRERHAHRHRHEELEHEHVHVHDEHHRHAHEGPASEPHSHPHRHAPLVHDHPHVPDLHHRHGH